MEIYNINVIKNLNRHTAVTVGMFDGVHAGHRQIVRHLTENARERGLDPVVVTFSNHPRSLLRPDEQVSLLTTFDERMQLLEQCGVETVVVMAFDNETAQLSACQFASRILCSKLNMKMLLLGYDNKFGSRSNDDFNKLPELATQKGFEIIHDEPLPMTQSEYISSTKIRKALISGNIELANLMLRTPYSITGVVEHGHHIGTTLGFPTANISLTANTKLLPADGVYALRAFAEAREHDEQTFNFQLSTFN
ncbi:MAG: riboflavin biosynthesis protein RibF, partial [Bacteroidales bacterium]|nr:riboflavin biosynthesis protein RibF [Bacteroidales bacterium]